MNDDFEGLKELLKKEKQANSTNDLYHQIKWEVGNSNIKELDERSGCILVFKANTNFSNKVINRWLSLR